jgi:hypothetical protein
MHALKFNVDGLTHCKFHRLSLFLADGPHPTSTTAAIVVSRRCFTSPKFHLFLIIFAMFKKPQKLEFNFSNCFQMSGLSSNSS